MTTLFSVKTRQKHRAVFGAKIRFRKFYPKNYFRNSNGILLEINLAATFSGIVRKSQIQVTSKKT